MTLVYKTALTSFVTNYPIAKKKGKTLQLVGFIKPIKSPCLSCLFYPFCRSEALMQSLLKGQKTLNPQAPIKWLFFPPFCFAKKVLWRNYFQHFFNMQWEATYSNDCYIWKGWLNRRWGESNRIIVEFFNLNSGNSMDKHANTLYMLLILWIILLLHII